MQHKRQCSGQAGGSPPASGPLAALKVFMEYLHNDYDYEDEFVKLSAAALGRHEPNKQPCLPVISSRDAVLAHRASTFKQVLNVSGTEN